MPVEVKSRNFSEQPNNKSSMPLLGQSVPVVSSPTNLEPQNNIMKGLFFMNLFAMCNTAVLALFKSCQQQGVSVTQFTFIRSMGNCLITSFLIMCQSSASFSVPAQFRKLLAARSFFGMAGSVLGVASLIFIPISLQTIIFQTNPFWSSLIAYFALKEAIGRLEIFGMIVCFAGVMIIATSSSPSGDSTTEGESQESSSSSMSSIIGCLLAFALAWSFASMGALNRKMHSVNCMTIMFYHTFTAAVVMLMYIIVNSISTGQLPEVYTSSLYGWICLSCVFDSISMNSMTFAYQSASPAFVSLIGQLSIVYAFIADALVFGVTPSTTELVGAGIIISVTILVAFNKILTGEKSSDNLKLPVDQDDKFTNSNDLEKHLQRIESSKLYNQSTDDFDSDVSQVSTARSLEV